MSRAFDACMWYIRYFSKPLSLLTPKLSAISVMQSLIDINYMKIPWTLVGLDHLPLLATRSFNDYKL